jgi:hypothetical protein
MSVRAALTRVQPRDYDTPPKDSTLERLPG